MSKSCIDLLLRYVYALCPAKPEAADSGNLVDRVDGEDFIDEGGLLELGEEFGYGLVLLEHLLSVVLLQVELLLIFVEFRPEVVLFLLDVVLV